MTNTSATDQNTKTIGPLSLKLHQEVWIVLDDTPFKLFVKSHSDRFGKYVLAAKQEEPSMPYYSVPADLHLNEKSAWVAIESSLIEARQALDSKLATIAQRIAELS